MRTKKLTTISAQVIVICTFFVLINILYTSAKKPKLIIDPQKEVVNINPNLMKIISVGESRMIASFLWVTTLLRSDLKHYEKNDYNNWMFLRLKLITNLSPSFYEAYLYGGIYLSIIKDDDLGAKYIYDKGVEKFPNDNKLLFNSGFHHFSELSDYKAASLLLERALQNGAKQPFLPTLVARLKSGDGNLLDALNLLENTLQSTPAGTPIYSKITSALYAINAEIDLECLNSGKSHCKRIDYLGNFYLRKSGKYLAVKKWRKFRIKKKPEKK